MPPSAPPDDSTPSAPPDAAPATVQVDNTDESYRYSGVVPIKRLAVPLADQKTPDLVLRVVSVSARQTDVALMVVGALLGSFRTPVSKEDYRGDKNESFAHPAFDDLYQGLQRQVDQWVATNAPTQTFKNDLQILPQRFQLVYRGSDNTPDPYDLKITALVQRKPDSAGFFSQPQQHSCESKDEGSAWGLADWEANNGERLKAFMQQFVTDCLASVQGQLPKMLAP